MNIVRAGETDRSFAEDTAHVNGTGSTKSTEDKTEDILTVDKGI